MISRSNVLKVTVAVLLGVTTGCESSDSRLTAMAQAQLDREAEQNRRMAQLHQQVAEGTSRLVEENAKARQEALALQAIAAADRAAVSRERDALNEERRAAALELQRAPIIAETVTVVGELLACALTLVACCYLLHSSSGANDDVWASNLMLEEFLQRPAMPGSAPPQLQASSSTTDQGALEPPTSSC